MNWFEQACRNLGLMIHHVGHPPGDPAERQQVSKTVEEQQVNPTTILRRTTIEEIEIKNTNENKPA